MSRRVVVRPLAQEDLDESDTEGLGTCSEAFGAAPKELGATLKSFEMTLKDFGAFPKSFGGTLKLLGMTLKDFGATLKSFRMTLKSLGVAPK